MLLFFRTRKHSRTRLSSKLFPPNGGLSLRFFFKSFIIDICFLFRRFFGKINIHFICYRPILKVTLAHFRNPLNIWRFIFVPYTSDVRFRIDSWESILFLSDSDSDTPILAVSIRFRFDSKNVRIGNSIPKEDFYPNKEKMLMFFEKLKFMNFIL